MTRSFLAASAALCLIACAAEPPAQPPAAAQAAATSGDAANEMSCTREYPIGSNIPVTKCRSRSQIEAERAAANEGMRRVQTGGPNAKMGDGR